MILLVGIGGAPDIAGDLCSLSESRLCGLTGSNRSTTAYRHRFDAGTSGYVRLLPGMGRSICCTPCCGAVSSRRFQTICVWWSCSLSVVICMEVCAYPVNAASPFAHGDSSVPPASPMMAAVYANSSLVVDRELRHSHGPVAGCWR